MSREIVRQPDGKFAVWSTVVDDFILEDAQPYEIMAMMIGEQAEETIRYVESVVKTLEDGKRYKHHKFWEECQNYLHGNIE